MPIDTKSTQSPTRLIRQIAEQKDQVVWLDDIEPCSIIKPGHALPTESLLSLVDYLNPEIITLSPKAIFKLLKSLFTTVHTIQHSGSRTAAIIDIKNISFNANSV